MTSTARAICDRFIGAERLESSQSIAAARLTAGTRLAEELLPSFDSGASFRLALLKVCQVHNLLRATTSAIHCDLQNTRSSTTRCLLALMQEYLKVIMMWSPGPKNRFSNQAGTLSDHRSLCRHAGGSDDISW